MRCWLSLVQGNSLQNYTTAGSNPAQRSKILYGPVAQRKEALVSGTRCCGFDFHPVY